MVMWLMSRMGSAWQMWSLGWQVLLQRILSGRSVLETRKRWRKRRLTWSEFYWCCICVKTTECIFFSTKQQKRNLAIPEQPNQHGYPKIKCLWQGPNLYSTKKKPIPVLFPQPEEKPTLKANHREELCHEKYAGETKLFQWPGNQSHRYDSVVSCTAMHTPRKTVGRQKNTRV